MSNVATGKITDYGHAPYKNDQNNQQSFFVEVENKNGSKSQFWGLGLDDALKKNGDIQKGDTVTLVDKGQNEGSRKREWDIEKYEPLIEHKNSIENGEKTLEKNLNVAGEKTKEEPLEFKKTGLKDELELPQSIKNNYVALVKNRLFGDEKINFYDKTDSTSIAFEDRKSTLNTSRNDEKTVNAMLDVAESKGWSSVSLKGTEEFKQKAWLEASLRGIETKGYQPNEQDLATLKIKQEERTYNAIKLEDTREKIVAAPVEQQKDVENERDREKTVEQYATIGKDKESTETSLTEPSQEQEKYAGIAENELMLVRVQKGLDGITAKNGEISIGRTEGESLRNTLHFSLNSVVQDHVYGKFSESQYAIIGNLKDTAQKNDISGLSPSDTFFFQKDGKVDVPNATLVIPDNHNLDSDLLKNTNTLVYKSDPDPEINYKNMTNAIQLHFENEKLPFKNLDFHGFVGERVSREEQINFSQKLGKDELSMNHASSLHGEMEERQGQLKSLDNDFKDGVKLHQDNWGVEIPLADRALNISKDIQESLNKMSVHEKEYYTEKLNPYLQNFNIDLKRDLSMPPPLPLEQQKGSLPPPLNKDEPDPIEIQNEKTVEVINTFRDELPQQEQGVNSKSGTHRLMVVLDNYKDKIEKKDLIAVEAYQSVIQEKYKDNPEKMNQRLDDLSAKIPDIAAGRFNLPEPPTIKHQVEIDVSNNKQGDKERGR